MNESFEKLRERCIELQKQEPKLRIRNIAEKLGVSEMELVAAGCCGVESVYLGSDTKEVFKELKTLGEVMILTRNEWCVHERHGSYEDVQVGKGSIGIVLGPDIDLRMFFSCWKTAWGVNQDGRRSIQFFDETGTAIHKVYCTENTSIPAYDALLAKYKADLATLPAVTAATDAVTEYAAQAPEQLRDNWLGMKDTHEFFPLLKKWNISRIAALQAAGNDLAQQLGKDAVEQMLQLSVEREIPIMCFVGNRGMVQIHSGVVKKLLRTGPWFNILDPAFNMHLNTEAIDSVWAVNKPTRDGWVTSIEVYEKSGELIVQFFGVRKPGVPELTEWRTLLESLCKEPLAA
ncbi:MAG: hemin-degrading factor [Alcaligenaceae bacterium]|nr:hemin-degrading factor [Alcaligenaceae bacterium]